MQKLCSSTNNRIFLYIIFFIMMEIPFSQVKADPIGIEPLEINIRIVKNGFPYLHPTDLHLYCI